jgi:hypothetical protein
MPQEKEDTFICLSPGSEAYCRALVERRVAGVVSPSMWHSFCVIETHGVCFWCRSWVSNRERRYALVNVWGVVHDVPCCSECFGKNNGKNREEL